MSSWCCISSPLSFSLSLKPSQRLRSHSISDHCTKLNLNLTIQSPNLITRKPSIKMAQNDQPNAQSMSKNAQKRLLKKQYHESRKSFLKYEKRKRRAIETKRKREDWEERLDAVDEDEKEKMILERREIRKKRMEKWCEEKRMKLERLKQGRVNGQNVVIDLDFADFMSSTELNSLVQQIMYCYGINGKHASPAHLWLTGCRGEIKNQLQQITGYEKWIIEREDRSYAEAFQDQKENLVYLTADSENILDELDPKAIYVIGGLVDKNRWKGITMRKADEQGIKTAKLPIGTHMKMSTSQILTVNQVVEILLKFSETKDWKHSFYKVIPPRKRKAGWISEGDERTLRFKADISEVTKKTCRSEDFV